MALTRAVFGENRKKTGCSALWHDAEMRVGGRLKSLHASGFIYKARLVKPFSCGCPVVYCPV